MEGCGNWIILCSHWKWKHHPCWKIVSIPEPSSLKYVTKQPRQLFFYFPQFPALLARDRGSESSSCRMGRALATSACSVRCASLQENHCWVPPRCEGISEELGTQQWQNRSCFSWTFHSTVCKLQGWRGGGEIDKRHISKGVKATVHCGWEACDLALNRCSKTVAEASSHPAPFLASASQVVGTWLGALCRWLGITWWPVMFWSQRGCQSC